MAIPYFDAHCDTIWRCWHDGCGVRAPHLHNCLDSTADFSPCAQVYAFWTDKGGWPLYQTMLALAKKELAGAKQEVLFSIEGAEGIECDPDRLPQAYADGVRAINFCWNYDNALAGSAMDGGGGLTEKGLVFLRACEDTGIIPDMSHISETAFWDVLAAAKKPVIASHSNSRALRDVPRNLTDAQFCALARAGGVAGLNYCVVFLGLGEDIDAVLAHAEHFLALGGEKALGLGSDFDGCDIPADLNGAGDVPRLYEAMLRRNYPESLVRDIFYNNFKRVFDEYPDIRKK